MKLRFDFVYKIIRWELYLYLFLYFYIEHPEMIKNLFIILYDNTFFQSSPLYK